MREIVNLLQCRTYIIGPYVLFSNKDSYLIIESSLKTRFSFQGNTIGRVCVGVGGGKGGGFNQKVYAFDTSAMEVPILFGTILSNCILKLSQDYVNCVDFGVEPSHSLHLNHVPCNTCFASSADKFFGSNSSTKVSCVSAVIIAQLNRPSGVNEATLWFGMNAKIGLRSVVLPQLVGPQQQSFSAFIGIYVGK